MRVLLTGAAGFIGSNFARRVADKTLEGISSITILDKLTYAGSIQNLKQLDQMDSYHFIHGDICNGDLIERIIQNFDAVINFAAESHVDRSIFSSAEFVETNVKGVQVLLDAIKKSGRVIRFLQVSTDEVYGSTSLGSSNEASLLNPSSPYSASKASGDLIATSYYRTHGIDVLITRCGNNYGPYQFPEKIVPLFITNLLEGKQVPIYGNGNNVREWLHVDDHCQGIYKVLINGKAGEIYNIGGGRELSNLEMTKLLLEHIGMDGSQIDYVEDRKGHDYRYSLEWLKAKHELNYEPKIKFEDGIKSTISWYQDNAEWWKPLKLN
jgi:dTDP-glucose 4,6-dehydratase